MHDSTTLNITISTGCLSPVLFVWFVSFRCWQQRRCSNCWRADGRHGRHLGSGAPQRHRWRLPFFTIDAAACRHVLLRIEIKQQKLAREREREKICTRLKQRFFFQIFMIHRCVWMFPSSFPFGYYHSHFSYWFFLIITTWMGWWRRRNAESVMKCNANPSRLGPETNGMPGHLNGKWAPARAPSRAPEPPSLSLSDTWLYAFEMHSTFHSNLLLL